MRILLAPEPGGHDEHFGAVLAVGEGLELLDLGEAPFQKGQQVVVGAAVQHPGDIDADEGDRCNTGAP